MSINLVNEEEFEEDFDKLLEQARWLALNAGKPYSLKESSYISVYHYMKEAKRMLQGVDE